MVVNPCADEDVAAKRMRYTSVNVSYGDDLDEVDGTPPFCVQVKLETKEDENKPERGVHCSFFIAVSKIVFLF